MEHEDALKTLIQGLRRSPRAYAQYGYGLYLPRVIDAVLEAQGINRLHERRHAESQTLSAVFYDAAWELCRLGVIRPGVEFHGAQSTDDGAGGNGYSITPFGKTWLAEAEHEDFVPTEPGRFARLFEPLRDRLGPGFYERSQEAIRCYGAHAYLACCAMCGAAAESILLAVAIAKIRDESSVLSTYASQNGRGRVEKIILGQAPERVQRDFGAFTSLLKYWRDEAAHGRKSKIDEVEAYTSLALLIRFAKYASDNWSELTGGDA